LLQISSNKSGFKQVISCQKSKPRQGHSSAQPLTQTNVAGTMKDETKGKYQEDFVQFGFTSIVINGEEKPQCVMCCAVNVSFNANTLMRHL
jgi:hypothetical protein